MKWVTGQVRCQVTGKKTDTEFRLSCARRFSRTEPMQIESTMQQRDHDKPRYGSDDESFSDRHAHLQPPILASAKRFSIPTISRAVRSS